MWRTLVALACGLCQSHLKKVRDAQLGGDLYLARASNTVAYAFRISGFDQVFCIYDTVDEALAAMIASRDLELLDGD